MIRILLIEDDPEIAESIHVNLSQLSMDSELSIARDGAEGMNEALRGGFDVIILDVMLPKLDGFEVCKRIREENKQVPILMLTARDEELDRVIGLEVGADDYLTKPFSVRELLARIKALLRRASIAQTTENTAEPSSEILIGELRIDSRRRKVFFADAEIETTATEFDLLQFLGSNPGKAFSREELLDTIWGYSAAGYGANINAHINRLRRKLEKDPSNPRYLLTVWGVGYRLVEEKELLD